VASEVASESVLDASVLLALLKKEHFEQELLGVLDGAVMSAVNFAEVLTKLIDLGTSPTSPAVQALFALLDRIEPFTETQATVAGDLRDQTRHLGLSLADRVCLALALQLDADVYTADRVWSQVEVGCKIHLIR
jgi:PIN domain nuclease of toxin-antitoxin system